MAPIAPTKKKNPALDGADTRTKGKKRGIMLTNKGHETQA